jgi:hypothetical protein
MKFSLPVYEFYCPILSLYSSTKSRERAQSSSFLPMCVVVPSAFGQGCNMQESSFSMSVLSLDLVERRYTVRYSLELPL